MATTLLTLATVAFVLIVTSQAANTVNKCAAVFNRDYNAASSDSDKCDVVAKLSRCVVDALATDFNADVAASATSLLSDAWQNAPACSRDSVDTFAPAISGDDDSITFHIGSDADIQVTQFSSTHSSVSQIVADISTTSSTTQVQLAGFAAIPTAVDSTIAAYNLAGGVTTQAADGVQGATTTASTLTASITASILSFGAKRDALDAVANGASPSLLQFEQGILPWTQDALSGVALHQIALQNALVSDSGDLTSMTSEDQALLATASVSIAAAMTSFTATEQSRATAQVVARTNELTAFSAALSTDLSSAILSEVNKVTARTSTLKAGLTSRLGSATNEYKNCSSNAGSLFGSGSSRSPFICSTSSGSDWFYSPILFANNGIRRAGSNIITAGLVEDYLLRPLGFRGTWTLCYDATTHGWSGSTFHTRCNNRGPTLTIALSAQSKVFGGFSDVAWKNRQGYAYTKQATLFRVSSSNTVEFAAYSTSQYQNYGIYDYSTYCPCFGGNADWYNPNCQSSSFSPSYFTRPSYSSTWLSNGYTSTTLSRLEVFYLTTI